MGWSIGYDDRWHRDIGYTVPAHCDHPGCNTEIDRGVSYVCGGLEPYGGDHGCGLYFCSAHRIYHRFMDGKSGTYCFRCCNHKVPYKPKPDHPRWIAWKLSDESWTHWRAENPEEVARLSATISMTDLELLQIVLNLAQIGRASLNEAGEDEREEELNGQIHLGGLAIQRWREKIDKCVAVGATEVELAAKVRGK